MTDWFRSWHGAPTDPLWVLIARKASISPAAASGVAWALFDCASQASPRGSVAGFDCEVYAAWGGLELEAVEKFIAALTERGKIVDGMLANWSKRQPEREDGSAERAKAWRERQRDTPNAAERARTQPNESDQQSRVDTEQITTCSDAGGRERDAVSDLRVAITREFGKSRSVIVPDTSRAAVWLERGWNPKIIIATIAEVLIRNPGKPKGLNYFEQAIADAHAATVGNARAGPSKKPRESGLSRALDALKETYDVENPSDYRGRQIVELIPVGGGEGPDRLRAHGG